MAIPCLHCKYDLSGVARDICPECGSSQRSLALDRLKFSTWNARADAALVVICTLSAAIGTVFNPILSLPPLALILVTVAFNPSTVRRAFFAPIRWIKVAVLVLATAMLLLVLALFLNAMIHAAHW